VNFKKHICIYIFITCLALYYLAGCSWINKDVSLVGKIDWEQHRHALSQIERWELSGRLGLQSEKESVSAQVYWQHYNIDDYFAEISGPLGLGTVHVSQTPYILEIDLPDGKQIKSENAAYAVYELTGWKVPLKGLQNWVKGIPTPDYTGDVILNKNNLLKSLQQYGWTINLDHYMKPAKSNFYFPGRIKFTQGTVKGTLIIKSWIISED